MQNDSNNLMKETLFMAGKARSQVVAAICYQKFLKRTSPEKLMLHDTRYQDTWCYCP